MRAIKIFSCSLGGFLCVTFHTVLFLQPFPFLLFLFFFLEKLKNILVSFSNKIPENIIALKYHWTKYDFYNVLFPSSAEDASYTGHYCTTCVFKSQKVPYEWSPLSIFAPEGHLDSVLVPRPLVKGLARLERGAVEMQTGCALCVAGILHTMQANGVLNSRSQKKEEREKKECNQHVPQECYKMLRKHYNQQLPLEVGSCFFISAMWQLTWFYISEDLGLKKNITPATCAQAKSPLSHVRHNGMEPICSWY